eukprot:TRINITY_DN2627_c0_g1_i1.p1 TRINITY_DN2627_c0_g1~~TRINITY_DN2627_c0_g1_i1.p1  ORF type:complete len:299 (+),score=1.58 TRINITY_DN2627_c0_g1_i1:49-897(+)
MGMNIMDILTTKQCYDIFAFKFSSINLFFTILIVPVIFFLLFLLSQLSRSYAKLKQSDSIIMKTYYSFIWGVCGFNLIRVVLSMFMYHYPTDNRVFSIPFLVVNCTLIFLEVSVVIFMTFRYVVSEYEAIKRTGVISILFSILHTSVQIVLIFVLELDLYGYSETSEHTNWNYMYWFISSAVFVVIYLVIMILPKTSLRYRVPSRASFYYYVQFLFFEYLFFSIGGLLVSFSLDIGYCFIDLYMILHFALYAPVLYYCFLAEFFRNLRVPSAYNDLLSQYIT